MGESVRFQTNDPALLAAADASFGRFPLPVDGREPLVVSPVHASRAGPGRAGRPGRRRRGTITEVINRTHGSQYVITGDRATCRCRRPRRRGRRRVRQPATARTRDRPLLVHRGDGAVAAPAGPRLRRRSTPPGSCWGDSGIVAPDGPGRASRRWRWPAPGAASGCSPRTRCSSGPERPRSSCGACPGSSACCPTPGVLPGARRRSCRAGSRTARRSSRSTSTGSSPGCAVPCATPGPIVMLASGHRRPDPDRAGRRRDAARRAGAPVAVGRWVDRGSTNAARRCWPRRSVTGCT